MEPLEAILAGIAASASGLIPVLYSLFIAALLDTLTGTWAAINSGTFHSKFLPEFITSHVVKKITPVMLTLVAGVAVGGTDSPAGIALVVAGGAQAAAYLASVLGSIQGNLSQGAAKTKGVPESVEPAASVPPPA